MRFKCEVAIDMMRSSQAGRAQLKGFAMISRVLFVGCILSVCSCGSTTTESAATSPEPQAATVVSVAENSFAVQDELPKRPFVEVQPIKFVEGREELPGYSPEAIELVVEPLQSAVLPYQAVVIRASIVNRTDKIVGPVADEMGVGISNGKPVNGRPWKVVTHGNSSGAERRRIALRHARAAATIKC